MNTATLRTPFIHHNWYKNDEPQALRVKYWLRITQVIKTTIPFPKVNVFFCPFTIKQYVLSHHVKCEVNKWHRFLLFVFARRLMTQIFTFSKFWCNFGSCDLLFESILTIFWLSATFVVAKPQSHDYFMYPLVYIQMFKR